MVLVPDQGGRCRRCRTATCWRGIRISAVFHLSSRRDSRSHAATRVIRRKRTAGHMIGDPHGRTAGRATLPVRATDDILGPRTTANYERWLKQGGKDATARAGEVYAKILAEYQQWPAGVIP
jgi:hypothetical protein